LGGLHTSDRCPECGADAEVRRELVERRQRRRAWLHSYWALGALLALPFLPLLVNIAAGIVWHGAWPWQNGYATFVENDVFPVLDVTAGLTFLGAIGSVLLWPFLVLLLAYTAWSRWCDRHIRTTPWWLWLLMLPPISTPFVLWWLLVHFMVFPD
jgi:hypothetical protein